MLVGVLSMLSGLGGFLRTPLGKVVATIMLVVALWGGFNYWLARHDAALRETITLEYNLAQEELTEQLRIEYEARMATALEEQAARLALVNEARDLLQAQADKLIELIRSGTLQGGESSEVLRATIQMLQDRKNGVTP
jgi:hypothetical protein